MLLGTAKTQVIQTVGDRIGNLKARRFRYVIVKEGAMQDSNDFEYCLLVVDEDDCKNQEEIARRNAYDTAQRVADEHIAKDRTDPPQLVWQDESGKPADRL